jgi:hypothetical protein
MTRCFTVLGALALCAGCTNLTSLVKDEPTEQVASHPFGGEQPRPAPTKVSYAPAAQEVAFRVDRVGQELVGANPQAGLRPIFGTIGVPTPEIFHVGTTTLYVTEGLVKLCPTDRELSAVLASELGRMVAEREAAVSRKIRDPDVPAPAPLPIGGHGYAGDSDPSLVFEMSKYETRHPRQHKPLPRPDPVVVAKTLLEKAGHQPSDLDAVQPILQAAENNITLERQIKGLPPSSGWKP